MAEQKAPTDTWQAKGYVDIDGERFFLDIPTITMWTEELVKKLTFALTAEEAKTPMWMKTILASVAMPDLSFRDMYGGSTRKMDAQAAGLSDIDNKESPKVTSGWRPILIPEKYPINEPNGTILTGGTWYLNQAPQPVNIGADGTTDICRLSGETVQDISIGETVSGKELRWIAWNGWLICQHILLCGLSHADLRRLGYGLFPNNASEVPTFRDGSRTMEELKRESDPLLSPFIL